MVFGLFRRRRGDDGAADQRDPGAPLPPVMPPEVPRSPRSYVKRVLQESRALLDSDAGGYDVLTRRDGWKVLRKPVEGTKLTMARLEADVPMAPDALFRLLRTMEGKRIIDPFPRERHSEPVKPLRAPRGGDAAVVFSEAPRFAGMLRPREYVTCDAAAPRERLFVCKSVEVEDGPFAKPAKGHVRANLLFAMRMKEAEGRPGTTRLQMINWLDLGANTVPHLVANAVTERWYFQGMMRRLNEIIQRNGLAKKE